MILGVQKFRDFKNFWNSCEYDSEVEEDGGLVFNETNT
jgi:hypothetical protein